MTIRQRETDVMAFGRGLTLYAMLLRQTHSLRSVRAPSADKAAAALSGWSGFSGAPHATTPMIASPFATG